MRTATFLRASAAAIGVTLAAGAAFPARATSDAIRQLAPHGYDQTVYSPECLLKSCEYVLHSDLPCDLDCRHR